jgi:hypothetical protein
LIKAQELIRTLILGKLIFAGTHRYTPELKTAVVDQLQQTLLDQQNRGLQALSNDLRKTQKWLSGGGSAGSNPAGGTELEVLQIIDFQPRTTLSFARTRSPDGVVVRGLASVLLALGTCDRLIVTSAWPERG